MSLNEPNMPNVQGHTAPAMAAEPSAQPSPVQNAARRVIHANVLPHSAAEQKYLPSLRRQGTVTPRAIVSSISPHPEYDLTYQGGKTITQLTFTIFYLGGDTHWQNQDRTSIDGALSAAMSDAHLNNVVQQYFNQPITSTFRPSTVLSTALPAEVTQASTEQMLVTMYQQNQLQGYDPTQTVFCFICPSGTILTDDGSVTSLNGLGGYHGAANANGTTLYYAIVAYAENQANGKMSGIVAFDQPWKNITAALYHELNEVRTDADVNGTIGWISRPIADFQNQQVEIGDTPVFEAGHDLGLVFKEVPLTNGSGTVPVQLLYSNAVHGPEGPRDTADPLSPTNGGGAGGSPITTILGILAVIIAIAVGVFLVFFNK